MSQTAEASPTSTEEQATPGTTQEPEKTSEETTTSATGDANGKTQEVTQPQEGESSQGQGAPDGEDQSTDPTFYSGDPSTLPPELRKSYDNMLRDYKKKTSEVSAIRQKAEIFDQLRSDPRFQSWAKSLTQEQRQEAAEVAADQAGVELTQEQYLEMIQDPKKLASFVRKCAEEVSAPTKKQLEETQRKLLVAEASTIVDAYSSATDEEGKQLHPNFEKLSNVKGVNLIKFFLDQDLPKNQDDWELKLDKAYKSALNLYQEIRGEGKSEALGIVKKKIATSTETPTAPSNGAVSSADVTKMSDSEAVKYAVSLARQGKRIPR